MIFFKKRFGLFQTQKFDFESQDFANYPGPEVVESSLYQKILAWNLLIYILFIVLGVYHDLPHPIVDTLTR